MQDLRKSFLLWFVLCSTVLLHAETKTYGGIEFSCSAVPQANLNGVTLASEVQTSATNVSGNKVFTRYRIVVTSSQGRVEGLGQGVGRGNFAPGAVESHTLTPFSKASVQDEFPKTCQFTQIQVCPATPPAGFPKGAYYRPFIDGSKECKAVGNITFALPPPMPAATCTAVTQTQTFTEGFGHHEIYAVSRSQPTTDAALSDATAKLRGGNYLIQTLVSGCGHTHGAIAASLKHNGCQGNNCPIVAPGIYEEYGAALADTQDEAVGQALTACHNDDLYKRAPYLDACQPLDSW
jgi:hypothetical protein